MLVRLRSDRMHNDFGGQVEARRDLHLARGTTAWCSALEDQLRPEDRSAYATSGFQRNIFRLTMASPWDSMSGRRDRAMISGDVVFAARELAGRGDSGAA